MKVKIDWEEIGRRLEMNSKQAHNTFMALVRKALDPLLEEKCTLIKQRTAVILRIRRDSVLPELLRDEVRRNVRVEFEFD